MGKGKCSLFKQIIPASSSFTYQSKNFKIVWLSTKNMPQHHQIVTWPGVLPINMVSPFDPPISVLFKANTEVKVTICSD